MTARELSSIYYINKEIRELHEELAMLKQQSFVKSMDLSDMPKNGEYRDLLMDYTGDVILLEDVIRRSLIKLQYERKKIEEFINSIEDPEIRMIVRLRAIHNKSWEDIGQELYMERTTVSKKYRGFLKK